MKKHSIYTLLMKFCRPYFFTYINSFLCITVMSIISTVYPYILSLLIDEVFYQGNLDFLKIIVLCYGIILFTELVVTFIQFTTASYTASRIYFDLRKAMFEKIFLLKAKYLSNIRSGELVTRINKDVDQVHNFINNNILYLSGNVIKLIATVVFLAIINWKLMLLMVVVVPAAVYASVYFGKIIKKRTEIYRVAYGKYISWVFEIIRGMRDIKLLAANRNVKRKFNLHWIHLIRTKVSISFYELGSERANTFISLLATLILYGTSTFLVLNGELTVGGLVASIDYFKRIADIFKLLNDAYMKIQTNFVSINKIVDLFNECNEEPKKVERKIDINKGDITFDNVCFKYEERAILKDINITVQKGEKCAIVGKSGSGKSTLVNLLLRFYEPQSGNLYIDGKNLTSFSLKSIRKSIGVVQQDHLLLNGTIKYNLLIGNPTASDIQILNACRLANAFDFVSKLPEGLNTTIGGRGTNLSGGQKQRLAIARIFLKNPKVLIFDEATSALDSESEKIIQDSWQTLCTGRTTIIIAHRLSTIINSDKVVVLDNGEVVSIGHHSKLITSCKYYQKLFKDQYVALKDSVA